MSIVHSTAARNAAADAVVDLLDTGSGDPAGDLRLLTSGDVVLVTMPLANPAFGASSSGVATASAIADATAAASGTAAKFQLRDRDNNNVITGTVTATGGGGDFEVDNTNIASGQTVSVTSLTYTAPT